jgi:solute carrier family 13 (sodium-dependent dicarboxylate transporter), member 2/3/5
MKKRLFILLFAFFLAASAYVFVPQGCSESAHRTASITAIAAVLWVFETLPLYVTSLIVILALTFAVAIPQGKEQYALFLSPFADPVIILFFGGFTLAAAMRKHHLDHYIAQKILFRFRGSSYQLLIGTMLTTAFIGLWISNTATAIIMLAIIQQFLKTENLEDNLKKSLVLSVPFAASIAGTGTPIASPPNAIAMGLLEKQGIALSFLQWMKICLPLVLIRIFMASAVLSYFFPVKTASTIPQTFTSESIGFKGKMVGLIALVIIILFITSSWTKIPEAITALIGASVLTAGGLLDREDIKKLDWDILILMLGGLSLGLAIDKSGLGKCLLDLPLFHFRGELLVIIFSVLAFILSTFMSNTTTAALLLPLALNIEGEDKVMLAITITLASSLGLTFPIASPPNALAYSTGLITSKEMFKAGLIVDLLSLAIIFAGFWFIIPAFTR